MKDYWLKKTSKKEPFEERWQRLTEARKHWEQRYAPFTFHLASWNPKMILAVVRGSKRSVPEQWREHGISHRYLALGVPFGEPRSAPPCALSIISHTGSLPSPSFVKQFHPELLKHLEHYSPGELRHIAQSLLTQDDDPGAPILLQSGQALIARCIPQRALQATVQIATMSAEPASTARSHAIGETMQQLGPRSILVDLRNAPNTHTELARRQKLKRNTFTWPADPIAQSLHPIELRALFGMKYRQVEGLVHFVRRPMTYRGQDTYPDEALERHLQVRVYQPERCNTVVDLIEQNHPLLLLDDQPIYETSLRRAIVIHLLSLFDQQVEIQARSVQG